jgi:hypothetical protein
VNCTTQDTRNDWASARSFLVSSRCYSFTPLPTLLPMKRPYCYIHDYRLYMLTSIYFIFAGYNLPRCDNHLPLSCRIKKPKNRERELKPKAQRTVCVTGGQVFVPRGQVFCAPGHFFVSPGLHFYAPGHSFVHRGTFL